MAKLNRYSQIISHIFDRYYQEGDIRVEFRREDLITASQELDIKLPKNIGDVIYNLRYRSPLPDSITQKAPEGKEWVIRSHGKGLYKFELTKIAKIEPSGILAETKILDSTPGIIGRYAINDEQSLLAKLRYNRLIDIFTGVTCYSLQNHLRTTVPNMGQIEIDELYVGVDQRGAQYVFPVEAKGGNDQLGIIQIEQNIAMCTTKFPKLICRPIAAQFMDDDLIALFAFDCDGGEIRVISEKHYRLSSSEMLSHPDLESYRLRQWDRLH